MLACPPDAPLTAECAPAARTRSRRRFRPAFTLLEVLVVVAILLILAGVGAFAATSYLARAKISQAKLQMGKIETAVKAYMTDNGGDPPANLAVLTTADGGKVYLEGGQTAVTDPWGKQYQMQMAPDATGVTRVIISTTDDAGKPIQWPDR